MLKAIKGQDLAVGKVVTNERGHDIFSSSFYRKDSKKSTMNTTSHLVLLQFSHREKCSADSHQSMLIFR
jgi:hypothetical protein